MLFRSDYLLNISSRKRISSQEESLLQKFNRCDEDSQQYLLANAGIYGNVIRFLAPLVITDAQLNAGLEIYENAIKACM